MGCHVLTKSATARRVHSCVQRVPWCAPVELSVVLYLGSILLMIGIILV